MIAMPLEWKILNSLFLKDSQCVPNSCLGMHLEHLWRRLCGGGLAHKKHLWKAYGSHQSVKKCNCPLKKGTGCFLTDWWTWGCKFVILCQHLGKNLKSSHTYGKWPWSRFTDRGKTFMTDWGWGSKHSRNTCENRKYAHNTRCRTIENREDHTIKIDLECSWNQTKCTLKIQNWNMRVTLQADPIVLLLPIIPIKVPIPTYRYHKRSDTGMYMYWNNSLWQAAAEIIYAINCAIPFV